MELELASTTATAAKTSLIFKMNSRFVKLCRVYANSMKMSNEGEFSMSRFLGNLPISPFLHLCVKRPYPVWLSCRSKSYTVECEHSLTIFDTSVKKFDASGQQIES